MRKLSLLSLLVVGLAASSLVWADHHEGEQKPSQWFAPMACDICKPMAENPELMMATKWETHPIKQGMIMVASAPDEHLEKFNEVCKAMDMAIAKIGAGEKPKSLCGFCTAMGELMEAGANTEKVKTVNGEITLVTSDNPETVKKIHEVAKRSQEEAKKMEEMMKQAA